MEPLSLASCSIYSTHSLLQNKEDMEDMEDMEDKEDKLDKEDTEDKKDMEDKEEAVKMKNLKLQILKLNFQKDVLFVTKRNLIFCCILKQKNLVMRR